MFNRAAVLRSCVCVLLAVCDYVDVRSSETRVFLFSFHRSSCFRCPPTRISLIFTIQFHPVPSIHPIHPRPQPAFRLFRLRFFVPHAAADQLIDVRLQRQQLRRTVKQLTARADDARSQLMQALRAGHSEVAQVHATTALAQRMQLAQTHAVLAAVERLHDDMVRVFRQRPAGALAGADASTLAQQIADVQASVALLNAAPRSEADAAEAERLIEQLMDEIRVDGGSPGKRQPPLDASPASRMQDELAERLRNLRRP